MKALNSLLKSRISIAVFTATFLGACAGALELDASATQIPPDASATQLPPSSEGKVQLIAGMDQPGVGAFVWPKATSPIKIDPEMEEAIGEVIASMTLEEKVGQTLQPEIRFVTIDELTKYHFARNLGFSFL